jgi:hypothetical protein
MGTTALNMQTGAGPVGAVDVRIVQEAVQGCCGGGHVAEEVAPVPQRPFAGHDK